MWNTFKYTVISLLHDRKTLMMALAFPLVLGLMFNAMIRPLDEGNQFSPIDVAVVASADYADSTFGTVMDTLSETGDDQVLNVTEVATTDEAEQLMREGAAMGYYTADSQGVPTLTLQDTMLASNVISTQINCAILKNVADAYVRQSVAFETIAAENPMALSDPAFVEGLFDNKSYVDQINVTANDSKEYVRYFYALLGFSGLMGANVSMTAICRTLATASKLGARRTMGATSRFTTLIGTLLASWMCTFFLMVVAFFFFKYGLAVEFGDRDALCVVGLAVTSAMATALGALVGSLPKISTQVKGGIIVALTCMLAPFVGLYGAASMEFADRVTKAAPLVQACNPMKQVSDLFYSLYYYTSLEPFCNAAIAVFITTVVFIAVAALFMRRQRYASL